MGLRLSVDLNADLGESFGAWTLGQDEQILGVVSSANVACGFHAGDPRVMDRTVAAAARAGVALGAHPGHWDHRGFGRREIPVTPDEAETDVLYQVGALQAFARAHGVRLVHVKPHGALYNQAARDPELAGAVARGVARADAGLRLVGLASSRPMREAAEAARLCFAREAFVDRAYTSEGALVSRRIDGALISDPARAAAQAVSIVTRGRAGVLGGGEVALEAETLCLHGDHPGALEIARAVRAALEGAGVKIQALG